MGLTYFKRYRMEFDLTVIPCHQPQLPHGYYFVPWSADLLELHADAKYRSFRTELDAHVFPCLGDSQGCRKLMEEISLKEGFLPQATWLVVYRAGAGAPPDYCGTAQGVRDEQGLGSIQNIGITPAHRGHGVGTCLVCRTLRGFREAGLARVHLEVTGAMWAPSACTGDWDSARCVRCTRPRKYPTVESIPPG